MMQTKLTLSNSVPETTFSAPLCQSVVSFSKKNSGKSRRLLGQRDEEKRARGQDVEVVASSAFQNMRPYFTDIYCLRNDSFFFWSR